VLIAVSLTGRREPVTETDPRPMLVGEQCHDMRVLARARDLNLEVLAKPRDERTPDRGSGRQRVATARSRSKPLEIFMFLHVEKAPVIAYPLDPG
jgi:hypothetical protein